MSLIVDAQERQRLAEADRHLDTANHCLACQFRALSTFGRHGANLRLAEAVLKTMLQTHQLMVQDKERIVRELGLEGGSGAVKDADSPSKPLRLGRALEPDGEATLLLKKNKLRSKKI